ncbi:MAG TPA: alpha/beta fold hydrolase [Gemmatimonadales bacterium]|nr:alpha/beta fold hydrolase [Gemmatimonadales bacterium]
MRFFRAILRVLQPLSPGLAAWLAERLFFTAPRRKLTPAARAFLASGARFTLRVEGRRVVAWHWGDLRNTPIVYLSHGWASRGSRLAAFTEPLLAAGYGVVTYDVPGNGASARGMTSMPDYARTLLAVAAHTSNGRAPHAIIAHSMGCSGTALALAWGLDVGRLAFLAPAADPPAWAEPFARALDLRPAVLDRLRARSERRLRVRWDELHVCDIAQRLPAPRRPPLLIVHDKSDETVAWTDGAAIAAAWPNARLITTDGLGHRGVTQDDAVVRQVVEFVTNHRHDARGESQLLEYELFYRDERDSVSSSRPRTAPSPAWDSR